MASLTAPARSSVHKVVCPHDCPDTCVMTVGSTDGRAVEIWAATRTIGSPRASSAPRSTTTWSGSTAPTASFTRCVAWARKGEGRFARISWDEALDEIADRLRQVIAAHGPQAILPYSYAGNMGLLSNAQPGPAVLPEAGGEPPRPDHLRLRGGARATRSPLGKTLGLRPRGRRPRPLHRGLGRQHRQLERPPLALRRRGASARGDVRDHRPLPLDAPRSRPTATWPSIPGTDAALALGMMHVIFRDGLEDRDYLDRYTPGRPELREPGQGVDARAHGGHHRPRGGRRRMAGPGVRAPRGRRPSASTTA